jgi:hypothetical protein
VYQQSDKDYRFSTPITAHSLYNQEFCVGISLFFYSLLYFDGVFFALTYFQWLMLFSCGGLDKFVLIYVYFVFVTVLCGSLREPSRLFNSFLTLCSYLCTVLICFRFVVGDTTPF